jgi:acetyltransferase-like isoleucine patch superfamily enzyme
MHMQPVPNNLWTFVGGGCVIGANAVVYQGCQLGNDVLIGDGTQLREDVILDDGAIVGTNCTVAPRAFIGKRSRVLDLSHVTGDSVLGEDVFWSVGVTSANDNSMAHGGRVVGPQIGDRTRIGVGAVILPGVIVGQDALIGSGSNVTKSVPDKGNVRSIPARPARQVATLLNSDSKRAKFEEAKDEFARLLRLGYNPFTEWDEENTR